MCLYNIYIYYISDKSYCLNKYSLLRVDRRVQSHVYGLAKALRTEFTRGNLQDDETIDL